MLAPCVDDKRRQSGRLAAQVRFSENDGAHVDALKLCSECEERRLIGNGNDDQVTAGGSAELRTRLVGGVHALNSLGRRG